MRKKIKVVALSIVCLLLIFIPITAKAQNNNIISYGNIEFMETDSEKVALYAEDLNYLMDEINKLKDEIQ